MTSPDAGMRVDLCLVSHTNVGKTALARTLLGEDVGEVRDAAHVTQLAEAHTLMTTPDGDVLRLWDTPGLGDSARLLRRLDASANPIGWFLSQVWDRWTDRPFFLAQQAMRAARDHADVVLYLVNATEAPSDAGYLSAELRIVAWLGKPVVVLLNQTGLVDDARRAAAEVGRWTARLRDAPVAREVLPLDAFARCWVHEDALFDALARHVPASKRDGYARLRQAWRARNRARFDASVRVLAAQVAEIARPQAVPDRAPRRLAWPSGAGSDDRGGARQALEARVVEARQRTTRELLRLHGLEARAAHPFVQRLDRADVVRHAPIDPVRAGVGGAIASGAATGLAADLASGGLTLGTGALVGAIAGAFAFALAAEGSNRARGVSLPTVHVADPALRALLQDALLKYLAIAHFGRGRGGYADAPLPAAWVERARADVDAASQELDALFARLRATQPDAAAADALEAVTRRLAAGLLEGLYPGFRVADDADAPSGG